MSEKGSVKRTGPVCGWSAAAADGLSYGLDLTYSVHFATIG